jgi:catechol 2,3-dioxygenase-like lactoylglutathione lyase family enzyme
MRKKSFLLFSLLVLFYHVFSQSCESTRPPVWGIAKMTFLVSDFKIARSFYGDLLGFEEAFSYDSDIGKVISFKVNDRQFLEFVQDNHAREKKRLVSVSFETGNEVLVIKDPSGNNIEFIDFKENGKHYRSRGQFLSDNRISKRIHHVGLYVDTLRDNDPFYTGILKFTELFRYPEDRNRNPTLIYFGLGDCIECIEHYSPNDQNISHPCFLVNDMQETINMLKERLNGKMIDKPIIGKSKRWILNIKNSDGTKVEFTEAFTVL